MTQEQCNAPSLPPVGATYIPRSGETVATSGAHLCQRERGHDGPHMKVTLSRMGPRIGFRTEYVWNDEHVLTAYPGIVEMEPDPMTIVVSNSTSASP